MLNQNEFNAVTSLVAYVAYAQNMNEEKIHAAFKSVFGVADIKALPPAQYDEAMRFLLDLRFDGVIN